jgi:D-sedoheptulose 7-phosphate isomerase
MVRRVRREITRIFATSAAVKRRFLRENLGILVEVIQSITAALSAGHKLLLFGNGGSAGDAQHIAAEFVGRFKTERAPLAAVALTTDTSALTAIANDYGYADVFTRQVQALGRAGDVALAISTSGNSPNVLRAVATCRRLGIKTVGLTGGSGGKLARAADWVLRVSGSSESARIQETHILVGHVICELVDEQLLAARPAKSDYEERK